MRWIAIVTLAGLIPASPGVGQTRSLRDTATAYGARLDAKGLPVTLNQRRINNRIENRINNRLSLRIERYRPDSVNNPSAGFRTAPNDGSRIAPVVAARSQQQTEDLYADN